jgi:hypothetical protein
MQFYSIPTMPSKARIMAMIMVTHQKRLLLQRSPAVPFAVQRHCCHEGGSAAAANTP